MLVLARRVKEVVAVECPCGETTRVVLVELRPNVARIGFEASPEVKIFRHELLGQDGFRAQVKDKHAERTVPIGNSTMCEFHAEGIVLLQSGQSVALDRQSVRALIQEFALSERRSA